MLIVPNTWIFQEINGMTKHDKQRMAKRNMDITQEIWIQGYIECTEKWIVNSRKFKGLPQQQHIREFTRGYGSTEANIEGQLMDL
jgi:hypothetical protein